MDTNSKSKATWVQVDEAAMGEKMAKQLAKFRELQKAANAARDEFNSAFIAAATKAGKVPQGCTLLVSHKFGMTSVAVVKADQKATKGTTKPKFSF